MLPEGHMLDAVSLNAMNEVVLSLFTREKTRAWKD